MENLEINRLMVDGFLRKRRVPEFAPDLPLPKRLDVDTTDTSADEKDFLDIIDVSPLSIEDKPSRESDRDSGKESDCCPFPLLKKHHARRIDLLEDELIRKSRRFSIQSSVYGDNIDPSQLSIVPVASATADPLIDKPLTRRWRSRLRRQTEEFHPRLPLKSVNGARVARAPSSSFAGEVSHSDFFVDSSDDDADSLDSVGSTGSYDAKEADSDEDVRMDSS